MQLKSSLTWTDTTTHLLLPAYDKEGWVIPSFRLPEDRVNALVAELDRVIEANPGVRPEKLISIHLENGKEGIKGSSAFLDLAMDPAILDLVRKAARPSASSPLPSCTTTADQGAMASPTMIAKRM